MTLSNHLFSRSFQNRYPLAIVIALALGYLSFLSYKGIQRHNTFNSLMDMAIYEQVLWNSSSGDLFGSSLGQVSREHQNFLGDHQAYILLLLTPIYFLAPHTETLIISQALAASIAGFLVYCLGCTLLRSRWVSAAAAVSFFGYTILHQTLMFDFHPIVFAIPAWLLAMIGLEKDSLRIYLVGLFLALLCKEEVVFTGLAFSAYLILFRRMPRPGLYGAILCLAVGIINFVLIGPHYAPKGESAHLARFSEFGSSYGEIISTLLAHPLDTVMIVLNERGRDFISRLLSPLLFLPAASASVITLLPYAFYSLMSNVPAQTSLFNQYPAVAVGPLFYSLVLTLKHMEALTIRIQRRLPAHGLGRRAMALLALCPALWLGQHSLEHSWRYGALSNRYFFAKENFEYYRPEAAEFHEALSKIPQDASVIAENNLLPHLAQRKRLEIWPRNWDGNFDYVVMSDRAPPLPALSGYQVLPAPDHLNMRIIFRP